jgi:F-type H+-transporting ATPase subunit a
MNMRTILAVLVIAAACFANATLSAHHGAADKFEVVQLFTHLVPAPLVLADAVDDDHGSAVVDDAHGAVDAHPSTHPIMAPTLGFLPAVLDMDLETPGTQFVLTNMQLFMVMSILLIFIVLGGIPNYVRTGKGDALTKVFAGFCMYIRDDMVYPVMGAGTGKKFLPYFLGLFFFIVFMNLVGLVPFSATPTAGIATTFGLSFITLLIMVGGGMVVQGPVNYLKHLVPEVPLWLWPLMFVVEIIGVIAKPFALMVRLFANMSGGHMVVLSFIGLIFLAAQQAGDGVGWVASPFAVGFAVFIMIIEAFVALLQAYVFTYLSILFIGGSLHPDH